MNKELLDRMNCSIASALELIGEGWTILILREAFFGVRRFEDFQRHLGIARNILTDRLRTLCDSGILQRVPIKQGAKRYEYKLTHMGLDLYPTLIALNQWGDRWLRPEQGAPVKFIERDSGEEIADVAIQTQSGKKLDVYELVPVEGPGASDETRARLHELYSQREKYEQDNE